MVRPLCHPLNPPLYKATCSMEVRSLKKRPNYSKIGTVRCCTTLSLLVSYTVTKHYSTHPATAIVVDRKLQEHSVLVNKNNFFDQIATLSQIIPISYIPAGYISHLCCLKCSFKSSGSFGFC